MAQRIVMTMHGKRTRLQGELTLQQAKNLYGELATMISNLEDGQAESDTLEGLIAQIGRAP